MKRIRRDTRDVGEIAEALEGVYERYRMPNGISYLRQGDFVHFSGFFDGTQDVVEIPKIPAKVPVIFAGGGFCGATVVEANAGFVKVPDVVKEAQDKKFVILCDCVVNIS